MDALSSETSVVDSVWNRASGVLQYEGASNRINGKAAFAYPGFAILGFTQLADFIIIQGASQVFTITNTEFFGSTGDTITNEDGDPITTEDDETLTT